MNKLISLSEESHHYFSTAFGSPGYQCKLNLVLHSNITIPAAVDKYRELIWSKPQNSFFDKIQNYDLCPNISESASKYTISSILLQLAHVIIRHYKPYLNPFAKNFLLAYHDDASIYFFDSYWFFASGHINTLVSTISLINKIHKEWLAIILIDKHLLLFPELINLLQEQYENILLVNVAENTLHLQAEQPSFFDSYHSLLHTKIADYITMIKGSSPYSYFLSRASYFNPVIQFCRHKSKNIVLEDCSDELDLIYNSHYTNGITLFRSKYTEVASYQTILQQLTSLRCDFLSKYDSFVSYHERGPSFRWPSLRDSPPLSQRPELIQYFSRKQIGVVVIGLVPRKHQVFSDNVLYLCNLPPLSSSFQIHVINASLCHIGSVSGATHLSHITNTPTILIDSPYPCFPYPPVSAPHFLITKRLFKSNVRVSSSAFYGFDFIDSLLSEDDHPLINDDYEMHPCLDTAISLTFELLLESTFFDSALINSRKSLRDFPAIVPKADVDYLQSRLQYLYSQNNGSGLSQMLADESILSPYNWV